MHVMSYIPSLILPKHAKTRELKDEHCVLQCTSVHAIPYP